MAALDSVIAASSRRGQSTSSLLGHWLPSRPVHVQEKAVDRGRLVRWPAAKSTSGRSSVFSIDNPATTSKSFLSKSQELHPCHFAHRVSFYEPIPFRATSRVGLLYVPKHCILSTLGEQPEGHANSQEHLEWHFASTIAQWFFQSLFHPSF